MSKKCLDQLLRITFEEGGAATTTAAAAAQLKGYIVLDSKCKFLLFRKTTMIIIRVWKTIKSYILYVKMCLDQLLRDGLF